MKKNILVLFLISSFISTCYINESTSNENYFPLEIGNWWLYNFNYKPFGNEPLKKNGNISWRVIDKNNDELYIQEIIEGKTIDWTDLDSPNPDTTYFGPDTAITKFLYVEDDWIKIELSFFKIETGSVLVKIYFPNDLGESLNLTNHTEAPWGYKWDNIKGDWNYHNIQLQKKVGIKYWEQCCERHSAPYLELNLVNYNY